MGVQKTHRLHLQTDTGGEVGRQPSQSERRLRSERSIVDQIYFWSSHNPRGTIAPANRTEGRFLQTSQEKCLRVTSEPTSILNIMFSKSLRIALPLILAALLLPLLPACTKKQGPTRADTQMGSGAEGRGLGSDIIPSSDWDAFGTAPDGLQQRGAGDGMGNGMYNGRLMQEGILPPVYFGFDSSSVGASERSKLQQAADYLIDNPSDGLLIQGRADWYGTAEYNLALGDRRANSVRDYLRTLGISPGRMETLSKGSLEATPGLPKSESYVDRRADLIILK